jgi:hypothetical protein
MSLYNRGTSVALERDRMKHVASLVLALVLTTNVISIASAQPVDFTWAEIVPPHTRAAEGFWGSFVSFDGEHILIAGPGYVDLYRWDGAAATFETSIVATSGDSSGWGKDGAWLDAGRIVVQARDVSPGPPVLYVFSNASGSWTQVARFRDPVTTDYGDQFFGSVAMNGSRMVVSAPYANTARGYTSVIRADAAGAFAWSLATESRVYGGTDYELSGSCLDVIGDRVLVGTLRSPAGGFSQTGRIALYRDSGSSLSLIAAADNPTPGPDDQFGSSCALLPSGFVVGCTYDDTAGGDAGAVYVFNEAATTIVQTIYGPVSPPQAAFGARFSLDGSWMAVSAATWFGRGAGSFFLYRRDASGMFRERARVMAFEGHVGNAFGGTLDLHGNAVVVGVGLETVSGATHAGRAWVGVFTEGDGGVCAADSECTHGHCVDGICCNTACTGACDSCGTGTCMSSTCDAGVMVDSGIDVDAGMDVDAGNLPEEDAGPNDAGPRSDARQSSPDASGVDAGGVPRVALSCTCRVSSRGSNGALLFAVAALVFVARRRPFTSRAMRAAASRRSL